MLGYRHSPIASDAERSAPIVAIARLRSRSGRWPQIAPVGGCPSTTLGMTVIHDAALTAGAREAYCFRESGVFVAGSSGAGGVVGRAVRHYARRDGRVDRSCPQAIA